MRFYIHLPEELGHKIETTARFNRTTKAEVIREALKKGLKTSPRVNSKSAEALLNLAREAEKIPTKGKIPKDVIENMDFYTWGGSKKTT